MVLATLLICGGALASCSDDDNGNEGGGFTPMALKLIKAEAVSASFEVTSQNVSECAYIVEKSAEAKEPSQDIIFAKGTHFEVKGSTTQFEVANLDPNTDYTIYLVGKSGNNFAGETLSEAFKTGDFTDPVTITSRKYDGFSVHFKVPEEVKERGNAIRFTRGVLPMYNIMKIQNGTADADLLLMNGGESRVAVNDMSYTFDELHSTTTDPETGEQIPIDDPLVPGEPSVLIAGEFQMAESDYGWGQGYYKPLFDADGWAAANGGGGGDLLLAANSSRTASEADFWTGFYHNEVVVTQKPGILNGSVKFSTPVLTPIKATMRFEPDENVERYCILICDDALLNGMILPMLNNNEEYLQWFITSYIGFSQLGAQSFQGTTEIGLDKFISEEGIKPGYKFHVLVTAMSGEHGCFQKFEHFEFTTPERTQTAPTIEVKAIDNPNGEEDPFEVWFNVKSVGSVPVSKCRYVANYEREMEYMFKKGETNESLVESKGTLFTENELSQINSAEGLNVRFTSRTDATTYFIAMGYNEEGLASEALLAKKRSISIPTSGPISSPYFKALQGDWTASAKVVRWNSQTNGWSEPQEAKFHVNIAQGVTYPAQLPDYVYDLYEQGMSRDEVDALYADFKKEAGNYAERLKNYNCLVCSGFNVSGRSGVTTKSPFDLFADEKYSAYNNAALFYDFGPKWFLHVDENGKISVPINSNQMDPLSNWKVQYGHSVVTYLVGLGADSYIGQPGNDKDKWPAFPVQVSEDMSTITIQPIKGKTNEGKDDTFYPTPIEMTYQGAQPVDGCKVVSGITLTKGWTEATSKAFNGASIKNFTGKAMPSANNGRFAPKVRPSARTPFSTKAQPVKRISMKHIVTLQEAQKNMNNLCNKWIKSMRNKTK